MSEQDPAQHQPNHQNSLANLSQRQQLTYPKKPKKSYQGKETTKSCSGTSTCKSQKDKQQQPDCIRKTKKRIKFWLRLSCVFSSWQNTKSSNYGYCNFEKQWLLRTQLHSQAAISNEEDENPPRFHKAASEEQALELHLFPIGCTKKTTWCETADQQNNCLNYKEYKIDKKRFEQYNHVQVTGFRHQGCWFYN